MRQPIDAAQCREQLARLLAEESALLTSLESQLAREHQLLKDNDVDGLEAAGEQRHASISQLFRVEDERRGLCRMLGHAGDLQGMQALMAWCDPEASLLPALRNVTERATHCREQNLRNGVLVNTRLHRVSSMLSMLNVSGGERPVYGPKGAGRYPAARAGRVLSTSA